MEEMVGRLRQSQQWTNLELFSAEYQKMTRQWVKGYCKEFPNGAPR
jgi:hypothetical protein